MADTVDLIIIVNDKSIYTFARLLRRICVAKQHLPLQIRAHPAGGFIVKDKIFLSFTINQQQRFADTALTMEWS